MLYMECQESAQANHKVLTGFCCQINTKYKCIWVVLKTKFQLVSSPVPNTLCT